jgi:hypothetical protein
MKSVKKYSHAYSLGFELDSFDPDGRDVTASQACAAILSRLSDLMARDPRELLDALDAPFDTYEYDEDDTGSADP